MFKCKVISNLQGSRALFCPGTPAGRLCSPDWRNRPLNAIPCNSWWLFWKIVRWVACGLQPHKRPMVLAFLRRTICPNTRPLSTTRARFDHRRIAGTVLDRPDWAPSTIRAFWPSLCLPFRIFSTNLI